MKKTIVLAGLCAVIFLMPAFSALPIKTTSNYQQKIPIAKPLEDYDGTWVGGYGKIIPGEEWQFEYFGYLGGVYKIENRYKVIAGNVYNLDQEQIGTIVLYNFKSIILGRISNMDGQKAPVIGFLKIFENNFFAGRLMSLFGPAPHIWGEFTPN